MNQESSQFLHFSSFEAICFSEKAPAGSDRFALLLFLRFLATHLKQIKKGTETRISFSVKRRHCHLRLWSIRFIVIVVLWQKNAKNKFEQKQERLCQSKKGDTAICDSLKGATTIKTVKMFVFCFVPSIKTDLGKKEKEERRHCHLRLSEGRYNNKNGQNVCILFCTFHKNRSRKKREGRKETLPFATL